MHSTDTDLLPTRVRQRRDTHERIYAVAEAEISEHGLAGLSIAKVAKAAGVSRQTFYDHFPTLDALVDEALRRYRSRVVEHLGTGELSSAPLAEVLHRVVDALFAARDRGNGRMRQEISARLARGVHVGAWVDEPLFRFVAAAVERGLTAGEVAHHHEPQATARLVLTALSGFLHIENEPPEQRARRAHDTVEILVLGLRAEPAEEAE